MLAKAMQCHSAQFHVRPLMSHAAWTKLGMSITVTAAETLWFHNSLSNRVMHEFHERFKA
jgi:hypothetical protein